jgi:hypothetical protein
MHSKTVQKFLITTFLLLISFVFGSSAKAFTVTSRAQMGIEDNPLQQDDNYAQPDSIIFTPIYLESDEVVSDFEWYQGIYYYQSYRLNQRDFLFHYLVSSSGEIYAGAKKGEEHRFKLEGTTLRPIIIGYMTTRNSVEFDEVARANITDMILEITNRNAIPLDNVFVKDIEFVAKPNEVVKARFNSLGGKWERSLHESVNNIKQLYKPIPKQFDLKIEKIELPQNPVNYGDNVIMNITITNNSEFILLKGNQAEPVISLSKGTASKFFQNGVWLSLSQASIMPDSAFLRPKETKTFQVRLFVPLYFGQQSEKFILTDTLGKVYPNTEFEIMLNINHPNKKVLEIIKSQQVNVRSEPWGSASIINRVTLGQRFIVLEETNDGWYKLDLGNNKWGWISGLYIKVV